MQIIKVDATTSTNTFLKDLSRNHSFVEPVCVVAHKQLSGMGQRGTVWQSEPGKNLTFSVLYPFEVLRIKDVFYVSKAVSVAIVNALSFFSVPKLAIKWPNDIMSANFKICGILIENVILQDGRKGIIIGIGLNVNQTNFSQLPRASSMKLSAEKEFDLQKVLATVLDMLTVEVGRLDIASHPILDRHYDALLFRRNIVSLFKTHDGKTITGVIKGVEKEGLLKVLFSDDVTRNFSLKEIQLLF